MNRFQIALAGLALLAIAGCSSSPQANSTGSTGSAPPPTPSAEPPKLTEADVHVPFYPGATLVNDKSMKVKTDTEESVLAHLTSTDDVKKVADFYQDSVKGLKFNEFKVGDATNYMAEMKTEDGAKIAITVSKKNASDPVEISIGYGKEAKK